MRTMLLALLLATAPTPIDEARAGLDKELRAHLVDVAMDGDVLALRILGDGAFAQRDPLWRILFAAVKASKKVTTRVDVAGRDERECAQRREIERYLFDKQHADRARLSVRVTCGAGFTEPSQQPLGALEVEAPEFLHGDRQDLSGVSFRVTNPGDAGVELTVEGLELREPGAASPPWPVPIAGLWFHDREGANKPYVQVRKDGQGPTTFTAPPFSRLEVMLQFEPVKSAAWRRIRVSSGGQRGVVAGRVVRISFFDGFVQGHE